MARIKAERDPARGAARLARLVHACERRPPRRTGSPIRGHVAAPHSDDRRRRTGRSTTRAAPMRPTPPSCRSRARAARVPADGLLGTMPKATLDALADTCDGSVGVDFGRPVGALSDGNASGRRLPRAGSGAALVPDPAHCARGRAAPTTSGATARRSSPTATTATSPAGRGPSAPTPTPRSPRRARAARCRRASSTSTATTRST